MKKNIYVAAVCLLSLLHAACDQEIKGFSEETNLISFAIPDKQNGSGSSTSSQGDSIAYSFGLDEPEVTAYTFKIPVNAATLPADQPRSYKVIVVEEETTAPEGSWDKTVLEKAVIDAGMVSDTLEVTVYRAFASDTEWNTLTLRLEENENFGKGVGELLQVRLVFSSILLPPDWWGEWQPFFGTFYREVYVKWQEIYYLGADPNVEKFGVNTGKQLYWDCMPNSPQQSWYPSTFMFIGKLKQYFLDNEVYPNGDTSKPRILLP